MLLVRFPEFPVPENNCAAGDLSQRFIEFPSNFFSSEERVLYLRELQYYSHPVRL